MSDLEVTRPPFTCEGQRFDSGPINFDVTTLWALKRCCGNAFQAGMTMHLTGQAPATTPPALAEHNTNVVDAGDGDIVTFARIGSGDIFVFLTILDRWLGNRTLVQALDPVDFEQAKREVMEELRASSV